MSDTVKIDRPWFPRSPSGPAGRVQHDDRGTAVWVRTRASDMADSPVAALSLVDAQSAATRGGRYPRQVSYFESGASADGEARRRPRDLRAYSAWIKARKTAQAKSGD